MCAPCKIACCRMRLYWHSYHTACSSFGPDSLFLIVTRQMGFDPGVFGCLDQATFVQPCLKLWFVCLIVPQQLSAGGGRSWDGGEYGWRGLKGWRGDVSGGTQGGYGFSTEHQQGQEI